MKMINSVAPTTFTANRLCLLLHNLCTVKTAIDALYESQNKGIMHDFPDRYLRGEECLNEAISSLSEYVGMLLAEEYLTSVSHE